MGIRGIPGIIAASIALAALLSTSGCAAQPAAPEPSDSATPAAAAAEGLVSGPALAEAEQRLRTTLYLMGMDQPDIGAVARDLVTARELEAGTIELIGVEEGEGQGDGAELGAVQLRVLPLASSAEQVAVCFSVTYNRYRDTGSEQIACDAGAPRIEPPVNTSTVLVVPADATEAAIAVLDALPVSPPAAAEIAAALDAAVTQPSGELEAAYPADVVVEGDSIGVAFGRTDDCALIARVDGVAQPVHVASISLQEGELGCFGSTAITTPPRTH